MPTKNLWAQAARLRPSSKTKSVRQLIDHSISATGASIASNLRSQLAFYRLANCLRANSNLLSPSRLDYPAGLSRIKAVINVCRNLASHQNRWIRQPEEWNGTTVNPCDSNRNSKEAANSARDSIGHGIRALIDHLLALENSPPAFMYTCWFEDSEARHLKNQSLFMHVAAGNSIRGTAYGKSLTRKMVARLPNVPADSTFQNALHQAQTGKRLEHRADFPGILTKRRRKAWIINPYLRCRKNISWAPINVADFYLREESPGRIIQERTWIIRQLTRRFELTNEGKRLQHCVGTYWRDCLEARTSIWAMESRDLLRTQPLLTIEVDPRSRKIVQISGLRNRSPRTQEISIISKWAKQESLSINRW